MTPSELKDVRHRLGLTQAEAAVVLETDVSTIQKMERSEDAAQHRKPPPRVIQLYHAYLAGYRPDTWPERRREAQMGE
jgi:transcriptional regulator with XRE-family HTH domain